MASIIAIVVVVLVGISGAITFFIYQGNVSEGNQQEAGLSAAYADGANLLSNCVLKTRQAAGLVNKQTASTDTVLKDAVGGRYGSGNNMDEAKLFSAIVEAYPDESVASLSKTFQSVLVVITGCQDDFASRQTAVQDRVRQFNAWRTGSFLVRSLGGGSFPNENMTVSLPGNAPLSGQAAFEKIKMPIVDAKTSTAYQTGEQVLDDPFADK